MKSKQIKVTFTCPSCGRPAMYSRHIKAPIDMFKFILEVSKERMSCICKDKSRTEVQDMKVKLEKPSVNISTQVFAIGWKCNECGLTWDTLDDLDGTNGRTISTIHNPENNIWCPHLSCIGKDTSVVSIKKLDELN